MLTVLADATQDNSLREAGIATARGLIAALPSDAENLFIILSAKALNPHLTVVTRVAEEEAGEKLRRAGADTVLTPYAMAGRQLADVLLRPGVVEFLDFARNSVGPNITTEQLQIAGDPSLHRTVGELTRSKPSGLIIIAVRRRNDETIFNPAPDTPLSTGDFLIVMGERQRIADLERNLGD